MFRAIIRGLRNGFSLMVAGAAWYYQSDPRYLLLAPTLGGICKYLRDKYGLKYLPM